MLKQPPQEVKKIETAGAQSPETTPETSAGSKETVTEEKPLTDFQRNFPEIEFKKIKGSLFSVKMDASENSDEAIFPKAMKDKMNSDLQNLYIRAVDGNTWVSYKIDNNPINIKYY